MAAGAPEVEGASGGAADVWQLQVPIRLALAHSEISSPAGVKPVYVLAPRHAYLPALAQQCLSFFQHVLLSAPGQEAATTPWFEHDGLALSWTQPLGVLHDLLSPPPLQQQQQQQPGAVSGAAAPWCLTVHYGSQPASLASSWQNSGSAKDAFLSSLKEAGYCCRGPDGATAVMRLPGPSQDELWAAANKGDGAAVHRLATPLRLQPTQRPGAASPTAPVRLYIRQHTSGSAAGAAGAAGLWDAVFSTSRPVDLLQPGGEPTLLAHLLHSVMPQRFPALQPLPAQTQDQQQAQQQQQEQQEQQAQQQEQQGQQGPAPSAAAQPPGGGDPLRVPGSPPQEQQPGAGGDAAGTAAAPPGRQPQSELAEDAPTPAGSVAEAQLPPGWPDASTARVLVCGVEPDWRTPLGWLHAHLRAADGFLYVVVHLHAAAAAEV